MSGEYPYPEDEFDALGAERSPLGVHRARTPRWRRMLPLLIVLILAPTLAFFIVRGLTDGGSQAEEPTTVAEQPTGDAGGEPTADAGGEPTAEPTTEEPTAEPTTEEPTAEPTTEEPTSAPPLDQEVGVWVLNGVGVAGLAGETAQTLIESGWVNSNADDYSSAVPTESTIYYDNAEQADEARAIAEELGIALLVESADAARGDIVIVLRPDVVG